MTDARSRAMDSRWTIETSCSMACAYQAVLVAFKALLVPQTPETCRALGRAPGSTREAVRVLRQANHVREANHKRGHSEPRRLTAPLPPLIALLCVTYIVTRAKALRRALAHGASFGVGLPVVKRKPTVLVVDDDPADRELIARMLVPNFDVLEATDVAAGLAEFRRSRPDCVLLDHHMPGPSGLDGLGKFVEHGAIVIMMTGD